MKPGRPKKYGTMTLTLSIPREWKPFFDELADNGYNRSQLMLKMVRLLKILYRRQESYPGGLPKMIERLTKIAEHGDFLHYFSPIPRDER